MEKYEVEIVLTSGVTAILTGDYEIVVDLKKFYENSYSKFFMYENTKTNKFYILNKDEIAVLSCKLIEEKEEGLKL